MLQDTPAKEPASPLEATSAPPRAEALPQRRCRDCAHLAPQMTTYRDAGNYRHAAGGSGRCARHRAAGLQSPEVGRELAALAQRCPAYKLEVPRARA
jgi:hypothetical protein